MPWNLLILLPLVGGFIFLDWCCYTRFRYQRIEGNRLLLESVFCAVGLTIVAFAIVSWLSPLQLGIDISNWWKSLLPKGPPNELTNISAAVAITAFLLGLFCVSVINFALFILDNVSGAAIYAAEQAGDYVMSLCYFADRRRKFITVQLSNGAVYMGYVKSSPNLKPESQLGLIVGGSGYLKKETLAIKWEREFLTQWRNNEAEAERFIIIFPTRMIENAHLFDPELDRDESVKMLADSFLIAAPSLIGTPSSSTPAS